MEVNQIYQILNTATTEVLGESVVVNEDLSNIVDVGTAVFNANSFDNYSHALVDKVGRMVFVNRPYRGAAPSVLMDEVTWGSVVQKVSSELPDSTANESYQLQNGTSYDPHVFNQPAVAEKFFAKYVTFEVDRSITERQLRSAFSSVGEMDAFLSMIFNEIEKRFSVDLDNLIFRTINSLVGDTLYTEYNSGSTFTGASHTKAVNLLYLYNTNINTGTAITAAEAMHTPAFLRYAAYVMGLYSDRLTRMSTLFNIGGKERFTPKDLQHFILLADFAKGADVYLQSDVWHNEFTALASHDTVPFWQGSGAGFAFDDVSSINIKTGNGNTVTAGGIIGVLFDRDALGVHGIERWVNTQYNAKADFTNYFYKYKAGYFNDTNENFVVFFVA
jgi:hypothetical protein